MNPGEVFVGRYQIMRTLGAGGMGVVYAANDLATGRLLALKTVLAHRASDAGWLARFELEAQVGARLNGTTEHVAEYVDSGVGFVQDRRTPYIAMELLHGEDLGEHLKRRGRLSARETWAMVFQIGKALTVAHAQRIIHRDLKPENVFLTRRSDGRLSVKVLDFGLAKLMDRSSETGSLSGGTLQYMPPEQSDKRARIGRYSDIWPLGLIAFRALTGANFWRAEQPIGILAEILISGIDPASQRAREVGVALPPAFDGFFARTVARDPTARFQTVNDAIACLQHALQMEGVEADLFVDVHDTLNRVEISPVGISATDVASAQPPEDTAREPPTELLVRASRVNRHHASGNPIADSRVHVPLAPTRHQMPLTAATGNNGGKTLIAVASREAASDVVPTKRLAAAAISADHPKRRVGGLSIALAALSVAAVALIFAVVKALDAPTPPGATSAHSIDTALASSVNGRADASARPERTERTEPTTPTPTPTPKPTAKNLNCANPYVVDANGDMHVKRECLGERTETTSQSPTAGGTATMNPIPQTSLLPPPVETAETAEGPGTIQVVCSPWGNVSIDGRPVGMTPIGAVSVPPGSHTVSATNSDLGASRAQTVKVVSGKTSFVKFDFKPAGE